MRISMIPQSAIHSRQEHAQESRTAGQGCSAHGKWLNVSGRAFGPNRLVRIGRSIRNPSPSVWSGPVWARSDNPFRKLIHTIIARRIADNRLIQFISLDFIHNTPLVDAVKQEEKGLEACGSKSLQSLLQWPSALQAVATISRNNHLSGPVQAQALRYFSIPTRLWVGSSVRRATWPTVTSSPNAADTDLKSVRFVGRQNERRLGKGPGRRFSIWGCGPAYEH